MRGWPFLLVFLPLLCGAQPLQVTVDSVIVDPAVRKNSFQKFISYFDDANREKKSKKLDVSFIGGPHYNSTTKFGVGLVAAGLYRMDKRDSLMSPSNVALYGDVTTAGFFLLGVGGNTLFPQGKYRLSYNLYFFSFPGAFWGVGYENGRNDAHASKFLRFQSQVKVDFLFRLRDHLYLGPNASFDYVRGSEFSRIDLLNGADTRTFNMGTGVNLTYDTRDFIPNPYKGIYLKLEQRFYPSFLGNKYAFSRTDLIFDVYQRMWKGGILAMDFHSQFNYGNTPWTMMAPLGGSYRMRGYYEGRFRDKNNVEFQIELRQKIWRRHGVAAWGGVGNVFKEVRSFRIRQTLPNYGVGYRWEFKKRVNVRLDYGFGRNVKAFMFNINEAF